MQSNSKIAKGAAEEIARNLSAIKGEDDSHAVENLTAIIRSHYNNATVQCADCGKWIDRDANHICKQQVRRNRRSKGTAK